MSIEKAPKQLTVRDVDDSLRQALDQEAQRRNLSLNQCIVHLLRLSLGLRAGGRRPTFHDLDPLAGTWSPQEDAAFHDALAAQRSIDEALWR